MLLETLIPIFALLMGWLLGQGSEFLKTRHTRRRILNQVLCELLETYQCIAGTARTAKFLSTEVGLSEEEECDVIRTLLKNAWDERSTERFAMLVTKLAAYDPISAYMLRPQDLSGLMQVPSQSVCGESGEVEKFAAQVHAQLLGYASSRLSRVILSVASDLGRTTRKNAVKCISNADSPSQANEEQKKIVASQLRAVLKGINK